MSSSSSSTQNIAFVSSSNNNTSSSNEAVNAAHGVTTASTQVNVANSTNIDNLSDAVIIAPRNQDNKNKESSRRSLPMETSTSTALVSCDGLGGYDWSDHAEVSDDSNCLKSCMETVKLLKSQNDQLLRDLVKSSLMVLGYKTGLESVEEKLEFYKKNESVYVEKVNGLKWDIQVGEITIRELRKKLEKIQKEKDSIHINVDKFENASKSLNKIIKCQIVDNCKKSLGYKIYNAVVVPGAKKLRGVPLLRLGLRGYLHHPHDSPLLRVNTLGSDEDSMKLQELMVLCTTLSKKVESLEADLKQTKKKKKAVSTGSGEVSTASRLFSSAEESVSTAGASMPVSTAGMVQEVNISIPSPVVVKDKGKGIMTDSEDEQTKRTKLQQEQDKLGHEAYVRLQEELDE
ncbi:hypothetical protein Tco_0434297 [Tanacetum coccineum]